MESQGPALVFEEKAAIGVGERGEVRPNAIESGGRGSIDSASESSVGAAAVDSMERRGGSAPGPQQPIDFVERPAAHKRQGAAAPAREIAEQGRQSGRDLDAIGTRGDLDQGSVEVEKQRRAFVERRRRPGRGRRGRSGERQKSVTCALHSKPSSGVALSV